jgi:Calpain family cysteine protease
MSKALQPPAKSNPVKGGPKDTAGSKGGLDQPGLDLSNSFVAQSLVAEAANRQGDASGYDVVGKATDFMSQLGKYLFAEDGGTKTTTPVVRKQQDAKLPELREKHAGSEWQDFEKGKAFVKGDTDANAVDPNDVKQGGLGDCYLMAGAAAVARADPSLITKLIKDNGDGTYAVTLYLRDTAYGKPKAVTQVIDGRLAVKRAGVPLYAGLGDETGGDQEMWVSLIEKAVAQKKGSYELISGGNIGKGLQFHGATEMLTGKVENYTSVDTLDEDDILLTIASALEAHQSCTSDTRNIEGDEKLTAEATAKNVYWNHAYAPSSVDLDARTINLQNPWGSSHVTDLSVKDFKRYYRGIRVGGGK